jgi:RNA polymerase sigma-70 factor (ECF subfamily)
MGDMQSAETRREWVLAALDLYEVRLLRYTLRLLGGDLDAARDAVQHAFLKLCGESRNAAEGADSRNSVAGPYSDDRLAAWLFRVCRNRAVDHLRQAGREQSVGWAVPTESEQSDGVVGTAHPTTREPGPAEASESRELAESLRELVAELPPAQREALDLWCEGFSYREIAEISSRQEGHVRVLVHRGLTSLRQHPRVRGWLESSPPTPSADRSAKKFISSAKVNGNGAACAASVPSRREGTTLRTTP